MCFILNNIFLTNKSIQYAKSFRAFLFFKLDFSKAHNKVDLDFLFKALDKFGFLHKFIFITRLLFRNAQASISING